MEDLEALIEKIDTGYRATSLGKLHLSVEGATEEETLTLLRDTVKSRLKNKIVPLETPQTVGDSSAWQKLNGLLENDPFFDELREIIEENRRQRDKEEGL